MRPSIVSVCALAVDAPLAGAWRLPDMLAWRTSPPHHTQGQSAHQDPFRHSTASRSLSGVQRPALIVFSHLRWGFVFQRPQHLLTRLAKDFEVFFVEEPVHDGSSGAWLGSVRQDSGVEVLTPHTPIAHPGFYDDQLAAMRPLIEEFVATREIEAPFVWLYTPISLPLLSALTPRAIIYDCMDDLASFKFAPPELVKREASLMKSADLVLTGGPSLYERRKDMHANIHCLPSAVDEQHFAPHNLLSFSKDAATAAALHEGLSRPRLGFFGVIDERLNLELVAAIADARPDWQVVMVGPVVKIHPATLPQRDNILWLGMQSYEMLPYLQAQWDVCILPFALNEATRFISPTKTLEYLAGEKPVISTPILDVVSLYGEVVSIAEDASGFVAAAEQALAASPQEIAIRQMRASQIIDACTWDGTAGTIRSLIFALTPAAENYGSELELDIHGSSRQTVSKLEASAIEPRALPTLAS